jgi:hypothetical protein
MRSKSKSKLALPQSPEVNSIPKRKQFSVHPSIQTWTDDSSSGEWKPNMFDFSKPIHSKKKSMTSERLNVAPRPSEGKHSISKSHVRKSSIPQTDDHSDPDFPFSVTRITTSTLMEFEDDGLVTSKKSDLVGPFNSSNSPKKKLMHAKAKSRVSQQMNDVSIVPSEEKPHRFVCSDKSGSKSSNVNPPDSDQPTLKPKHSKSKSSKPRQSKPDVWRDEIPPFDQNRKRKFSKRPVVDPIDSDSVVDAPDFQPPLEVLDRPKSKPELKDQPKTTDCKSLKRKATETSPVISRQSKTDRFAPSPIEFNPLPQERSLIEPHTPQSGFKSPEQSTKLISTQKDPDTPTINSRKPKTPFSHDSLIITPPQNLKHFEKTDSVFNVSARDFQFVLSSSPSPKESIIKKSSPKPKTLASALISADSDSSET